MRLVADPLEQLEAARVAGKHDGVDAAGHEDLLLALRERDDRHARQIELLHRRERRSELALPAVDDDEVRLRREALVPLGLVRSPPQPGEATRDDLSHRGDVVGRPHVAHAELPVVRLLRSPSWKTTIEATGDSDWMFETSKHSIRSGRLSRLSASRNVLERGVVPQPLQLSGRHVAVERQAGVLRRHLLEPPLLAALGRAELDPRPAPLGQELGERAQVAGVARDDHPRAERSAPSVAYSRQNASRIVVRSWPPTFSRWNA